MSNHARDFAVQFGSGLDVLNSYWGYLSDGGLVVDDTASDTGIETSIDTDETQPLEVGEAVVLSISIASSGARYQLRGKVVRRQADGHVVIAFDPGQPHDLLLSEALAETDNVPARRHRRYAIDLEAHVASDGDERRFKSRLVNISREGCCVHLGESDRGRISVGTPIAIDAGDISARGQVVWQRNLERGVRFDAGETSSLVVLHEYLRTLY